MQPFAGIYIDAPVAALKNNVVGGSEDGGIVFQPEACGTIPARVSGNRVHSAKVGVWLLSNGAFKCVQASGFQSWLASHVAVLTVDQTNSVQLSGIVVADSHIGVSLNHYGGVAGSKDTLSGSVILGSTAATAADCSTNSQCKAATSDDMEGHKCNSVFGAGVRRVGLMTPQYTNRGKTCFIDGIYGSGLPVCRPPTTPERLCSLPWEKRYGLPYGSAHGELVASTTTFAYFAGTECAQRSTAIAWNPTQRDFAPPISMSTIGWREVAADAKFDFRYHADIADPICESGCDGLNQLTVSDLDGTVTGQALAASGVLNRAHTVLATHGISLANPGTACVEASSQGILVCPDTRYRELVVENMDEDRMMRKVGPLKTMHLATSENRTDVSWGPVDDSCPMRFFEGRYFTQVQPSQEYHLEFSGSNPTITRLSYRSPDAQEAILVRFFYTQPKVLDVLIGDTIIDTSNLILPTLDATTIAGASQFNPQQRHITLLLRGNADPSQQVYSIVQKPIIQLTLALEVTLEVFYGPFLVENLSKLLSIGPERIRIVSVQAGSVIVVLRISDAAPTSANITETSAQIERLGALTTQIRSLAAAGQLTRETVGYDVISLMVVEPGVNGTSPAGVDVPVPPFVPLPAKDSLSSLSPLIIGIIVVVAVLLVGTITSVAYVLHQRKWQRRTVQANKFLIDASKDTTVVVEAQHAYGRKAGAAVTVNTAEALTVSISPRRHAEIEMSPVPPRADHDEVSTVRLHSTAEGQSELASPSRMNSAGVLTTDLSRVPEGDSQSGSSSLWKSGSTAPHDAYSMRSQDLPEGHYICVRSYAPKFADELSLEAGDAVVVLDSSSADWMIGYSTRTGKRGSFPKTVVSRSTRVVRPAQLAAAEVDAPQPSPPSNFPSTASVSSAQSASLSPTSHGRMDSSGDILAAQEAGRAGLDGQGWSSFERANRAGRMQAPAAIQHKHSGLDRQQSRRQ